MNKMCYRICAYRNCNNDISHKRMGAKYCSSNCKSYENTYRKRRKRWIEKVVESEKLKIEAYKKFRDEIKIN